MEKGHAFFRKAQRQRSKKRERSRIFPEGPATGEQKERKVTHIAGKHNDRGANRERKHHFHRLLFTRKRIENIINAGIAIYMHGDTSAWSSAKSKRRRIYCVLTTGKMRNISPAGS